MKINSEMLFEYVNNLGTDEKVKFNVYYDDAFTGKIIYWDGENFNWESGRFSSGAFFNPLYDFEIIEEKPKKIDELDNRYYDEINKTYSGTKELGEKEIVKKINELVKAVNYLLEKSDRDE